MPPPVADCSIAPPATPSTSATSGRGGPNINPETGLSTDYLNHFTEAVMALEMAGTMPECLDDLRAWRSRSYLEHFAASRFGNRDAIISAYRSTDPEVRATLGRISKLLDTMVKRSRKIVFRNIGTPEADAATRRAVPRLRTLIAQAAAVINGTGNTSDRAGPQAAIDAIFRR